MTEQEKYEAVWSDPKYRRFSPGEFNVLKFLTVASPRHGETVRDLGCGSGRAGIEMTKAGLEVTQYDLARNCRDLEIDLPFVQHDLTRPIRGKPSDYVYCCDVLEHVPEQDALVALANIVRAGRRAFLSICTSPDDFGHRFGEPLHLTVKPAEWWREQLEALDCKILWEQVKEDWYNVYVIAYADATEYGPKTVLNVSHETVFANVKANMAAGYKEVEPHEIQDTPLMVMAGGPSLNDYKDEIIERRKAGELLVTVNNTHQVAREWGIEPSVQIMCDAREFNRRFVENPFPRTKYLIASQCHPSVAASLPHDQVWMWHSGDWIKDTIAEFAAERGTELSWWPIYGGGTVMLRAIPLMMMLGYRKFECFGWDGSLRGGEHHAYSQPENDKTVVVDITVGGKTFHCHPWMVAQAGDWMRVFKVIGPHISLIVHGDGLIAHIIQTGAGEL